MEIKIDKDYLLGLFGPDGITEKEAIAVLSDSDLFQRLEFEIERAVENWSEEIMDDCDDIWPVR